MRLTVIGASGGIGRHLCGQASAAGHEVTAVVRNPSRAPSAARVAAVDLADPDDNALVAAVTGADAVLSALGPRASADAGIAGRGTRAVIDAMGRAGVRRLVVVSAAPVGTVASPGRPHPTRRDPGDTLLVAAVLAPVLKRVLRRRYADLALMEEHLRGSGLDWTVIRPPRLTDGPGTGNYRTALDRNVRRGLGVTRSDVAHLMLDVLTQAATIGHTVGVASR